MIYTVTLNPAIDRELLVNSIEFDTVLRATSWQVDFGGKGMNVSRLLLGFDTPSVALGFVGGGSGKMLDSGLQSLGITTDFIWVDEDTRTNVSIRSETQSGYIKVNEPGPTLSEADVDRLMNKIDDLAQPDDWWVLAGSLPPACPETIYRDIITLVQERGAKAVLDTSGVPLEAGCQAAPFLIKPNHLEALGLLDAPDMNALELAEAIRVKGPTNVVISLGPDGAVFSGPEAGFSVQAPTINEKNPIGAGDSMVGGMVWALAQGFDCRQMTRWGVACGAATAAKEGTSLARQEDAKNLLDSVQIEDRKKN